MTKDRNEEQAKPWSDPTGKPDNLAVAPVRNLKVFDPRVQFEDESAKAAAQIVWSTQSINLALEAIDKGLPLRASPFYDNNPSVRKPNLLYQYTEEEVAELIKCRKDILYFANKYCYLKTPKGFRPIKLRPYQIKVLKNLQKNRFNILLMARQMGKTTTTSIFLAWYTLFNYDKTIALLGQKASTGYEILGKVKQIITALPFFLKPGVYSWNAGSYSFDNGCRAITKATTIDSLQGFTIDALFIDEVAYIKKNLENPFWENIYPTISANPESKIILCSTPNGKNLFYRLWTTAIKQANDPKAPKHRFIPTRVDWHEHPDRDEEWKEQEINAIGIDAFAQQYGLSFDTAVKALLKSHTVKHLKYTARPFVPGLYGFGTDYEEGFTFSDVFNYNFFDDYFVISVDVSEGLGQDASTIKIYKCVLCTDNKVRLVSVAKFEHYHCEISEFAKVICKMMTKFDQEKSRLIIERNTYGDQVIIHMESFANNHDGEEEYDIELETFAKFRRSADNPKLEKGLRLNKLNKRIGASGFKDFMDRKIIFETDSDTIEQIYEFGEDDKGRFRAAAGHDDLVMPIVNMAYYVKSENYGWLDLVDEMKEAKKYDTYNQGVMETISSNFVIDVKPVDSRDEKEEDAAFNYDLLKETGLVLMNPITGKTYADELTEYDMDKDAEEEDSEYDELLVDEYNRTGDLIDMF